MAFKVGDLVTTKGIDKNIPQVDIPIRIVGIYDNCVELTNGYIYFYCDLKLYTVQTKDYKGHQYVRPVVENSKGIKYDSGKPDLTLLPYNAQTGIAKAFMYGAEKYGRYNYLGGMKWMRIAGGVLRHIGKFINGKDLDEESGLNHLYHAGAGIMMLIEYFERGVGEDDRYKKD